MTLRDLKPGDILGQYRIEGKLGAGGMGLVFLAQNEKTGSDVALKLLHPRWSGDSWLVELFHKEAELVRSISHPNLVALLDSGSEDGLHYMIFEFIHGVPLDKLIREGPTDPTLAASIIQDVGMALSAAHGVGVVHRDIKPANVMITPDDHIKLIDFGVADKAGALVSGGSFVPDEIAGPGTTGICGTRVYAAPEQNQGRPATPAADVYSLGILAYELYAGKRLFPDGDISDVLRMQAGLQSLLEKNPGIHPRMPPPIARVVRRMLQLLPKDRYPSAVELLYDLEGAIEDIGGIQRDKLRESKKMALLDLTDSLFLQAQISLDEDQVETATAGFSRILALNPPNMDRYVQRIRQEVERVFWRPAGLGVLPTRLLDMLEELGLTDLRFLVEHRVANSAGKTATEALRRLNVYLGRWPRSTALLRAACAAARGLEDDREVDYQERLGDALLDCGEPEAALRQYSVARSLRPHSNTGPSYKERIARSAAEAELRPALEFHQTLAEVGQIEGTMEVADAWRAFIQRFPEYRPGLFQAVDALEAAGAKVEAALYASSLGRRAFFAGSMKTAKYWLLRAVYLDPDRDEALLYLAEMSGGVPTGQSVRNQRVTLLRRLGLSEAALYHREKELTGSEADLELLDEMADIASEWGRDPAPFLLRIAQFELDQGNPQAAAKVLIQALERTLEPAETAMVVASMQGAKEALPPEVAQDLEASLEEIESSGVFALEEFPGNP